MARARLCAQMLVLLFLVLARVSRAATSVRISDVIGDAGTNVTVPIAVTNADGINGFRIAVTYSSTAASYVSDSVSTTGMLAQGFSVLANESQPGSLYIVGVGSTAIGTTNGDLLSFQLHIASSASGSYPITIVSAESNLNGGNIPATFSGGTLAVSAQSLATLSLPTGLTVDPGGLAIVPVNVAFPTALSGFRIAVNYDSSAFSYESGSLQTSGLLGQGFITQESSTPGRVVFVGARTTALAPATGTFLRFSLRAAATSAGTYPMTFDRTLTELNGGDLGRTLTDGTIRVRTSVRTLSLPTFTQGQPGATVSIPVTLNDATNLSGFRLALSFEDTNVQYLGIQSTGTISAGFTLSDAVISTDRLVLSGARATPLASGSGELIRFQFKVLGSPSGIIPLQFDPLTTELNDGSLLVSLAGGTITLGGRTLALAVPASVGPAEEFELSAPITDTDGLDGFRVAFDFDTTQLSFVAGSSTSTSFTVSEATPNPGRVVVTGARATPMNAGAGTLFKLRLRSTAVASRTSDLLLASELTEMNAGLVPVTLVDASLIIPARNLSIPHLAGSAGTPISIPVRLNNGSGIDGFKVAVDFSADSFTLVPNSVVAGPIAPNLVLETVASSGHLVITGATTPSVLAAPGDLLSFQLLPIATAVGSHPLTINADTTELNAGAVAKTVSNGSVTFGSRALTIPLNITAGPESTFIVSVRADNGAGINGFRIGIDFDPAALAFDAAYTPNSPAGFREIVANTTTPGRVILLSALADGLPSGTATLVAFRLRATGAVSGTVALSNVPQLTELNAGAVPVTVESGSVVIPPAMLVSPTSVQVPEGGTNTFSIRLAAQPSSNIAVSVARDSGDPDITVLSGSSLTFTTANWDTTQVVTLAAAEDPDAVNGTAIIRASAPKLASVDVAATEVENDVQAIIVSTNGLSVPEGGTATFTVQLAAKPTAAVIVTASRVSGDIDITIRSGASLSFSATNWNTPKTVTIAAAEDFGAINGTASIRLSSSGLPDVDVLATEVDNDTMGSIWGVN